MILGGYYPNDPAKPATCGVCGTAIHDGNTCVECWRDLRELAAARYREWWS